MRILLSLPVIVGCVWAQGFTEPPLLLQLVRKPGTRVVSSRPYPAAGATVNVIGTVAITGLSESWLIEAHDSLASIEALDRSIGALGPSPSAVDPSDPLQADVLSSARTMIAAYRHGWSYRPAEAARLFPKARYFQVVLCRVRLGTESDFGELVRLRRAASDSINLDRPELAYQVISGAPAGTFIFLTPFPSLASMDEARAPLPNYAEPLAASRARDGQKAIYETELSRERLLLRVDPRISWVSDAFAEPDRMFWRGNGSK